MSGNANPDMLRIRMRHLRGRSMLVLLRNLLGRIPFKPIDVNCLYFLEYTGIPRPETGLSRTRYEIRRATLDDLPGLTECEQTPETFLKRFARNEQCAVAVSKGRIVGYEWFCDKSFHSEERYAYPIEIAPDAIYAYDAFILPEHRLSGIWPTFKAVYLRESMQRLHRRKIITMIDRGNYLSMKTHLRFGFQLIRRVFVLKLFGKSFFMSKNITGKRLTSVLPVPLARSNAVSKRNLDLPSPPLTKSQQRTRENIIQAIVTINH